VALFCRSLTLSHSSGRRFAASVRRLLDRRLQIAGSLEGSQYWRRRNQDELTVKWIADATKITSDIDIT